MEEKPKIFNDAVLETQDIMPGAVEDIVATLRDVSSCSSLKQISHSLRAERRIVTYLATIWIVNSRKYTENCRL